MIVDAASIIARRADEEVVRKLRQYGHAVHLFRKVKDMKAKLGVAHASVA
jgi:hypothetical protein